MIAFPVLGPLLFSTLFGVLVHPHVPKAIIAYGAGGKVTVQYFTVPYNPEHLKDLKSGFEWHLGYAAIENEAELRCGDIVVPPTRWKMGVVRGETAAQWSVLLEPFDLWQAKRSAGRNPEAAEKAKTLQAELAEKGIPERVVLPATRLEGEDAEHLEMELLLRGYQAAQRNSSQPAGGLSFATRFHFGDLHFSCDLQEQFQVGPGDTTGRRR